MILLDCRFEYDKRSGDRLGAAQWRWLENVSKLSADVTMIALGVQAIPDRLFVMESLGEQNRLKLLNLFVDRDIVILSGDVHYAQSYRLPAEVTGKLVYEVTSSGLSHT